jgi:hypothetical protein
MRLAGVARVVQPSMLMSPHPAITCNDPALETALSDWLLASRMSLPDDFRLRLTVVDAVGIWDDPREGFLQGEVEIRAGVPLGWVHLSWRKTPARGRVEADRPEAMIEVTPEVFLHLDYFLRSFVLITLIFLWKRAGHYHVHAASAISPGGRRWMLIGDSCSGKSTTTALLALRGWQVSTDDIAFLRLRDGRAVVVGFRSPIALRPGGLGLLGQAGGMPLAARAKTGFWPEELGARWVQVVEPDVLLFTSVGGEQTTLAPMSAPDVMRELMQWSMWVLFEPTAAQEHLDLLSQLARQTRSFRAAFAADLFDAPGALEDFRP